MNGKPVRIVRLRVIGGVVPLRDDVPATRAECPKQRPCPHVRCEWHLWMVDGRDRPGRRGANWKLPESELGTIVLEWPLPPSCGADLLENADLHSWTCEQKARLLGLTTAQFQWTLRTALRKLHESPLSEFSERVRAILKPRRT